MNEHSGSPAGWYPDRKAPGSTRYWDGTRWTDQRAPAPTPMPGGVSAPAPLSQPPATRAQQKTNGMAIASLVLDTLWIWWVGSVLALIFGYVGKNQSDESGGAQGGRGLAIAGIVLGWVGSRRPGHLPDRTRCVLRQLVRAAPLIPVDAGSRWDLPGKWARALG
jgi:hypothetical protein